MPQILQSEGFLLWALCGIGGTALLSCIHSWVRLQDIEQISGPAE